MVDRGKVIKGLKYCKEYFSCCDKCPYWHSGTQCVTDLANDAFDLLKEQEEQAMPVDTKVIGADCGDIEVYCCRACRFQLDTAFHFCPNCGKGLIWE